MPDRISIARNEPVPLKLSKAERQTLLDDLTGLDVHLVKALRKTAPGQAALLSLEDLDELAELVADEAKGTKNKKLKSTLRRIVDRIDETLDSYIEFIPRGTGRPKGRRSSTPGFQVLDPTTTPDSVAKLFDWTTLMLVLAEISAGQRRLAKVRTRRSIQLTLSARDRALIVKNVKISRSLKALLGSQDKAIEVSIDDLASVCYGLSEKFDATSDQQDRVERIASKVAKSLASGLRAVVGELADDRPKLKVHSPTKKAAKKAKRR